MSGHRVQYLNARGVLREVVVHRELSPQQTERLQEYLQNTEISTHNLSNGLNAGGVGYLERHFRTRGYTSGRPYVNLRRQGVGHLEGYLRTTGYTSGRPYVNLRRQGGGYPQGLGWRYMWAAEERLTQYFPASSGVAGIEPQDQQNRLIPGEAAYLQERGLPNNDLTSAEEDFLREYGLDEVNPVINHVPDSGAADHLQASPEIGSSETSETESLDSSWTLVSSWKHGQGCPCQYPWTCNPRPEPPSSFCDGRFGPVGQGRPTPSRTRAAVPHLGSNLSWEQLSRAVLVRLPGSVTL